MTVAHSSLCLEGLRIVTVRQVAAALLRAARPSSIGFLAGETGGPARLTVARSRATVEQFQKLLEAAGPKSIKHPAIRLILP